MKSKMFVESLFSHKKIEQVMEPARFFLFFSLNGYDVNGVAGFFDKLHQVVGFKPHGGGVVVGVDADDAAVFGKLFVQIEVHGVFGIV